MSLFLFPKGRHKRRLSPRQFRNYRTYKPYLQAEFARLCVYCRQPDSSAPNLNFQVDHYRPKSESRFKSLIAEYSNLYYCCQTCNTYKSNYWPPDETAGPYVVNPVDFDMAAHLRFDAKTGSIEPRTPHGKFTEELLHLNDPAAVKYRRSTLTIVQLAAAEIARRESDLRDLERSKGRLGGATFDAAVEEIKQEIEHLRAIIAAQDGTVPLRKLPSNRNGLKLLDDA